MALGKSKSKSPTKRSLGVILEDMNSKFDLVLEEHAGLDEKIENFHHELKSEISDLKLGQKDIMDYLSRIDDEIQVLKKLLNNKADLEKLERLEQKVAQIELVVKKHYKHG